MPTRQQALLLADQAEGWLNPGQAEMLYDLAAKVPFGGDVIEIGSYCGKSTIALAAATQGRNAHVYCIDTWPDDTIYHVFEENMARFKDHVSWVKGRSDEVLHTFCGGTIDLIFIDGDHEKPTVEYDFNKSFELLHPGGVLIMHDICPEHQGPLQVWEENSHRLQDHQQVGTMVAGVKPWISAAP